MNPTSPLPAIAALLVAVATSFFLAKQFGAPPIAGRNASIDGLRGYLAFFVFLHHSCVWYFYLETGQWNSPPSNLYTHFGQSSVAVFFMITGFLFFSKLIEGRTRTIDWGKLFVSRFLRLAPLYFFAMFLLFLVVALLSNGVVAVPTAQLMKEVASWLGFALLGAPDLNGVEHTSYIIARVTWSLRYEWFFYLSLPILAVAVGVRPPRAYIALGVGSLLALLMWHPEIPHLLSFLGGIAASILVRSDVFRQFARGRIASLLILACVLATVVFYPSAYELAPLALLSVAFALIACGNNLFGLLVSTVSHFLGEMAYGIYLLHGIVLFVVFNFIIGLPESRALSSEMHWLLVAGITPFLLVFCFTAFRLIERPAMQSSTRCTAWLRSRLTTRSKRVAASNVPLN